MISTIAGPHAEAPPLSIAAADVSVPLKSAVVPPSSGIQLRFAGGYGFGVGDHTGSFRVFSGDLNLQSAVGSSGDMVAGQIWLDRWLADNVTIGMEYLAIRNTGKLSLNLPQGVSILTDPVYGAAEIKARADLGFLNLAYRQADGTVHAFIGGGVGIGYGHASAGFSASNAFLGSYSAVAAVGSTIAGVQVFTGVDFDLGPYAYVGIMPRVVILDAYPIGIDQRYMDFGVTGLLGVRF